MILNSFKNYIQRSKTLFGYELVKPTFLIIGAQKCGTTALYKFLSSHPQLLSSEPKEIDFFSCEYRFKKGINFYHKHFYFRNYESFSDKYSFEASPSYLVYEKSAERILSYNPSIRVVCIVRNPIKRAFSAWNMYRNRVLNGKRNFFENWMKRCLGGKYESCGYEKRDSSDFESFNKAICSELKCVDEGKRIEMPILNHGLYGKYLKNYLDVFPKNQILVIENKDLLLNTTDSLSEIIQFLSLNDYKWKLKDGTKVFKTKYEYQLDNKSKKILSSFYEEPNEYFFDLIGKDYGWNIL